MTTLLVGNEKVIMIDKKSFTLFELLLVVTIMGILIGLSFPRFRGKAGSLELRSVSKKLFLLTDYARTHAVLGNNKVELSLGENANTFYLKQGKDKSRFSRIVKLPDTIVADCNVNNITFYPDGSNDEFNLTLRSRKGESITLKSSGSSGRVIILN